MVLNLKYQIVNMSFHSIRQILSTFDLSNLKHPKVTEEMPAKFSIGLKYEMLQFHENDMSYQFELDSQHYVEFDPGTPSFTGKP